jgi:hypothetical protein
MTDLHPLAAFSINSAGESCYKTSYDEGLIRKACKGIKVESAMCAQNVEEVDEILEVVAARPLLSFCSHTIHLQSMAACFAAETNVGGAGFRTVHRQLAGR